MRVYVRKLAQPVIHTAVFKLLHPANRLFADAQVGHHNRQKNEVGEDDDHDSNTGGNRQVLDHLDLDNHQCGKTDTIGNQCGQAGHIQRTERKTGRPFVVPALGLAMHDCIDHLHAVAHTDREHQERDQHGVRVKAVAQHLQQADLPDHRDHGADHHGDRGRQAA